MVRMIPQRELRNENAKLMDAVTAGETFIITRNGEPVAELRPVRRMRKTFIGRDELGRLAGASIRIDPAEFRRDLDSAIDQSL
ncbi:type II toxin-antitoxin system prevent-host-death family antitoxin [Mycolicibacterium sp. S2-37]|uniref:type II toxin-antitoxin system Phd/YefM family antitoxin n=1 Tax=Mycolicibacterium sp. S2-37 TaxID=2810297 RepID=UPI001A93FD57|nr:type II toxin-antitoxin system prevent-host-death family antitoxin [Mycolicibacterium sp. S2-37]MBO0679106.1 type II toxin-antitoxin system prevent-host-death family antitoxin [Mycolicibacterium sp. S2-37]